jgi:hypothetical protein
MLCFFFLLLAALPLEASASTFSDQCLLVYPKANPSNFSSSASQDKNTTQVEPADWNHGTSTAITKKDLNKPNTKRITFHIPPTTQVGDTLFLFLHRTEAVTPLNIDKWTRATECLKQYNEQKECFTFEDCIKQEGAYCSKFDPKLNGSNKGSGNGSDLNVGVYYRHVTDEDPTCWTIELPSWRANWITVTAIPDVNKEQPIASSMGTSCDVSRLHFLAFITSLMILLSNSKTMIVCLFLYYNHYLGQPS